MSRSAPFTRTAFLTRQAERVTDVMLDLLLSIGEEVILDSAGKLSLEERAALIHMASVRVAATTWKASPGTREMYLEMCETMWDSLPEPEIHIALPPNRELRQNLELARELNAKHEDGTPISEVHLRERLKSLEAERATTLSQVAELTSSLLDFSDEERWAWESPAAR